MALLQRACAATLAGLVLACGTASVRAGPAEHTVVVEGMAYSPASLHVKRGDRIIWVNRDLVPHTATAKNGAFNSGRIAAGGSWATVAGQVGKIDYGCTYHPTMGATLVVE